MEDPDIRQQKLDNQVKKQGLMVFDIIYAQISPDMLRCVLIQMYFK